MIFDMLAVWLVIYAIKNVFEDVWSGVKGQSNPRLDRRKARQKSRANNPIWQETLAWLGDIWADAHQEANRKREEKRRRQERERAQVIDDLDEPEYRIDPPGSTSPEPGGPGAATAGEPEVVDVNTPPPRQPDDDVTREHKDLDPSECRWPRCPEHHPENTQQQKPDPTNNPYASGSQGAAVAIEIKGLDPAIDYANDVAASHAEHGTAGNEGYLGALQNANVTGETYSSAAEAQEASTIAAAKWERHAQLLAEGKRVQEAQDAVPDAGTQEFNQGGR